MKVGKKCVYYRFNLHNEEESMTDEQNYEVLRFLSTIPDPRIDQGQ